MEDITEPDYDSVEELAEATYREIREENIEFLKELYPDDSDERRLTQAILSNLDIVEEVKISPTIFNKVYEILKGVHDKKLKKKWETCIYWELD